MPKIRPMPAAMLAAIEDVLAQNRDRCIALYAVAETIRKSHEEQNVALEDVVAALVEQSGRFGVALSFERPAEVDVLTEIFDVHSAASRRAG